MLGAAPETRGSIAAVVDAYRAHGLFKRWPIDYLADCTARAAVAQRGASPLKAARDFVALARAATGASRVHAHVSGARLLARRGAARAGARGALPGAAAAARHRLRALLRRGRPPWRAR